MGNNDPHVQQAQREYDRGVSALASAEWGEAMKDFSLAFKDASQAVRH